jgi:hypothetical protein
VKEKRVRHHDNGVLLVLPALTYHHVPQTALCLTHTAHDTHSTACGATRSDQASRRRAGGRLHSIRQGTPLAAHALLNTHTHDLCTHTTGAGCCVPGADCVAQRRRAGGEPFVRGHPGPPPAHHGSQRLRQVFALPHPRTCPPPGHPTTTGPPRSRLDRAHKLTLWWRVWHTARHYRAVCGRCTAVRW